MQQAYLLLSLISLKFHFVGNAKRNTVKASWIKERTAVCYTEGSVNHLRLSIVVDDATASSAPAHNLTLLNFSVLSAVLIITICRQWTFLELVRPTGAYLDAF